MTDICTSDLYANQVICEVIDNLDETKILADTLKDQAIAQLGVLSQAAQDEVAGYSDIDYSGPTALDKSDFDPTVSSHSNVSTVLDSASGYEPTYTDLLPTAPTIPDQPTVASGVTVEAAPEVIAAYSVGSANTTLIGSSGFDDVYNRAKAREARTSLKEERDAQYLGSAQGIGMASSSLLKRLDLAQQATNEKISDVTLNRQAEEAVALREDVKTLHDLNIRNWPLRPTLVQDAWAKEEELEIRAYEAYNSAIASVYGSATGGIAAIYTAQTNGLSNVINAETNRYQARLEAVKTNLAYEAEKRGWTQLKLQQELETAEKATAFAIQKAQATLAIITEAEKAVAQLMIGLAQGLYSALDYSLSGSGSQAINNNISQTE
jgi:hypothetical protein